MYRDCIMGLCTVIKISNGTKFGYKSEKTNVDHSGVHAVKTALQSLAYDMLPTVYNGTSTTYMYNLIDSQSEY